MSKPNKLYKDTHTLSERQTRFKEQKEKYPDMVPIIVEKSITSKLPELLKVKYLVNHGFKFNQFKLTIKGKLNLDEKNSALFLYCGKTLINDDQTMEFVHNQYKDKDDGFLYLTYTDTEAFG